MPSEANPVQPVPPAQQECSPANGPLDEVMPALYAELRRMADAFMRKERRGHTLQPTALVHEAYLRLAEQRRVDWANRAQVLGVAGRIMRRVLADYACSRNALKRMGRLSRTALDDAVPGVAAGPDVAFLDLERALTRLEEIDPQMASIVELRFFGGLTIDETAEVTGLSTATVEREWSTARVWLLRQIRENGQP